MRETPSRLIYSVPLTCFSLGHTSADLPAIDFEVIVVAVGTILDVEVDEGDTESAEAIIQSADEVAAVESWKIAAWVTGAFDVELLEGVQSIAAGLPPGFRRFGTWIRLRIKEARGLRWWALVRATLKLGEQGQLRTVTL